MNMGGTFSNREGKSYYYNKISIFINESSQQIIGKLVSNAFNNNDEQIYAWANQIDELQQKLGNAGCTGDIIFEYDIVRLGKRIDVILLIKHMVFSLEFKNGATAYLARDAEQAEDYALDLKNFHKESENLYVCPILVATNADDYLDNKLKCYDDGQIYLQLANSNTLMDTINNVCTKYGKDKMIDFDKWYNSRYCPTPTIIEAATEAYINHTVSEIAYSEAGQDKINSCESKIAEIVDHARTNHKKCLCFVTGVPGAGKTLVGLDIASRNLDLDKDTRSVYISGNGPLIKVLRKSLVNNARNRSVETIYKDLDKKTIKNKVEKSVQTFIQEAYAFRRDSILSNEAPIENVLIFDEAQRCWSKDKLRDFVKKKMNKDIDMSEPEFFIDAMNRRDDWAVIVCLVGLGQDIYDGEVGINEWFTSCINNYSDWEIYYSNQIFKQIEDTNIDRELIENFVGGNQCAEFHLSTSIRSFRSKRVSEFVDYILAGDSENAQKVYAELSNKYPIYITRNISKAKAWARKKVRGSQRCGVVACSSAQRLKPDGIYVPTEIDVENWFLAPKDDLRSSNFMEIVASEFKVQGLEIDYAVVCWDADLRRNKDGWEYYNFRGTKWQRRNKEEQKRYLVNAYRVLLTRARQGFVIFIPEGDDPSIDPTRDKKFYDFTYEYLIKCGIKELE